MKLQKHTFDFFQKISFAPQRMIFANINDEQTKNESEQFELKRDWTKWKKEGFDKYKAHIKEALQLKEINAEEAENRIRAAEEWFKKEAEKSPTKKWFQKIKEIEEKNDNEKIADKAVKQINRELIENLTELRNFVRNEIENLGINIKKAESESTETKNKLLKFNQEIETRIESLLDLDNRKHQKILHEIHKEKELAKKCWQKMNRLFSDEDKKDFLEILRLKKIPAGVEKEAKGMRFDIKEILSYQTEDWRNVEMLSGLREKDLFMLERALIAVETLYEKWKTETDSENKNHLFWRLDNYENNIGKLKFKIETNVDKSDRARQIYQNWEDFYNHRKNDINQYRQILTRDNTSGNRKLLKSFLDGSEDELKNLKEEFQKIQEAEPKAQVIKPKKQYSQKKSDALNEKISKSPHGHGHDNIFVKFGKKFRDITTVNGKIVWYSFHDITESFKLIKEAWSKYNESASEDKRSPLAEGIMFWKKEVARRIEHVDLGAEKSRCDDLKKTYKNYEYEELISELAERPAKDRRRAIIEIIADRGNLRMSDKRLINIICGYRKFTQEQWDDADASANYTLMREAFKTAIDEDFIGETGYGKELLSMHNSGFSSAEDSGKKYASSNEATSTNAEMGIFNTQLKKAQLEGEGIITGMLSEMVDRANTFSNNKAFSNALIKINGKETNIKRNSDMGFVGMQLTDAFLKGIISRELLEKIGKGHEQCFRPFSVFQEVLGTKEKTDPITGEKISHFEYWGWIDEKKGTITELGSKQLLNFFNTRNAVAEIKQLSGHPKKEIVHMATDTCFRVHSGTRVDSIEKALNNVGDKFAGYTMKASAIDVFDNATKVRPATGAPVSELRAITSLIKAGVEDFIDGAKIVNTEDERYFDSFKGDEVDKNGYLLNEKTKIPKIDQPPITPERITKMGEIRMDRGKEIIVRILKNMWMYREDREILKKQPLYSAFRDDDMEDGTPKQDAKSINYTLAEYLKNTLGIHWGHTAEYQEIMKAYSRLEDPNQKLKRNEIEEGRRLSGDIESKDDLIKKMHTSPKSRQYSADDAEFME